MASFENNQANFCNDSPLLSNDFANLTTSAISDIHNDWNPIFDEKIFYKSWLWFEVKDEHEKM